MGVEVGAADPAFDADRLAVLGAEAEAGGAVVAAPDRLGWGEGPDLEALVGVDEGRQEVSDLAGVLELPGQVLAHQRRHAELGLGIVEQGLLAGLVPERIVDVAGVAGQVVVPLGHKGHGLALQVSDLLDAVLEDRVAVGHVQGIGVADVDLLLARAPLALGVLDRDAGALQAGADRPHDALFLGRLEDVVVLDVGAGRRQLGVVLGPGALVGLVEEVELQLRGEEGAHLHRVEARRLALQDRPRRDRDVFVMVVIEHVAEHQGRALKPGDPAQGREVRLEHEVAVALLPVGQGVAGHRLHVDVVGQQVVAAVGLAVGLLGEVLRLEALADQAAEHVDHADQHGVDLAAGDGLLQFVEGDVARHGAPLVDGDGKAERPPEDGCPRGSVPRGCR